nr:glycosyltransferase family A protein [uncultured Duganella sp.]
MFFSVIIPCYNVGPAIDALLAAVTAQLDADCELVLVNDGSADDTGARIEAFLAAWRGPARIVYRATPNAGAARARALGLELASGRFIYFCDSDDVFAERFVATVRRAARDHPGMELMYFSADMVLEEGGRTRRLRAKTAYTEERRHTDGDALLALQLRERMYTAAVWTYVASRALIARSGAAFTPRAAHEDHLFTLRLLLGAALIVTVPDLLYQQRVRQGSLTNSRKTPGYVLERIAAFREADALLRARGAGARRAYAQWTFEGVMDLLRANRPLLPRIVLSPLGGRYLAANAPRLVAMLRRRRRA